VLVGNLLLNKEFQGYCIYSLQCSEVSVCKATRQYFEVTRQSSEVTHQYFEVASHSR
jgi:hypothetical protein